MSAIAPAGSLAIDALRPPTVVGPLAVVVLTGGLPGVTAVDVNLDTGQVTIDAEGQIDPGAVSDAVAEAGYAVAS